MNTAFFFGANTPYGFKGYLDDLYDPFRDEVLLIKGSPGSGKNTIMKKVLEKLETENIPCEEIHCSSDPDSLDGIIAPSINKCIFDATAPHIMEPKYWGICETVIDLSHCLERSILNRNHEKLFFLLDKCSYEHKLCCCEITKASFIRETYTAETEKNIDKKQVIRKAIELAEDLLPTKIGFPHETRRFLSAVSPRGITFFLIL